MSDLVPPRAAARQRLLRTIGESFASWGYELVHTPAFEHADVIERGLDTLDRRDLLRFVDADTGEVALLRPDITPQIARVVATRLGDRPPPHRLAYEGEVIRRRRGRARRQRQIAQAGVECVGMPGPAADIEVIELATRTLERLGLTSHRIELGLAPLARTALAAMPDDLEAEAAECLSRKDRTALIAIAERAGLSKSAVALLGDMVDLWGGADVLERARKVFGSREARARLDALESLHAQLTERGLGERLSLDLGEVRGFGYYTGPSFVLLAEGPGEPIGSGGRYDELLGRFGAPLPATGFGLDLDHLEWALATARLTDHERGPVRLVVAGEPRASERAARALRTAGAHVSLLSGDGDDLAERYARAWGHDGALIISGSTVRAIRLADGARKRGRLEDGAAWIAWCRSEGAPLASDQSPLDRRTV